MPFSPGMATAVRHVAETLEGFGATVTEGIFNVPGVGNTLFEAIRRGEGPTVVSFVTVFVILYVLVNLLIDLLYGLLDPRIRYV